MSFIRFLLHRGAQPIYAGGYTCAVTALRILPKPESTEERVGVVSHPGSLRQLPQFLGVSSAENDVVEQERGDESLRDRRDALLPFLPAQSLEPADTEIVLERLLRNREMTEFQWYDGAVDHHGGPETRPEAEEEHRAPSVAPERLHRRVVDHLHRAVEGGPGSRSRPTLVPGCAARRPGVPGGRGPGTRSRRRRTHSPA